jgi:hypothetical protein
MGIQKIGTMNGRKKLLITLGCSWTEGQGCQIPYQDNWPIQLGKKLGFDKVYNFGKRGGSHSGQVKLLYDYLSKHNLDNYHVLVIFLMTEPTRFSFYINHTIQNYMIKGYWDIEPIEKGYLETIEDLEVDPTLEQVFYIRTLESLCLNNNFDLLVTTWADNYKIFFDIYQNPKINLFSTIRKLVPPKDENWTYFAPCSHPNELGYEWIANEMYNGIKEKHSKWYSDVSNPNIQYEWLGEYGNDFKYKGILI